MANINWEIVGHFTPEGEIHVSGLSLDGQVLFDEPLILSSMIGSLCESVEVTPEHQFSEDGVRQVRAMAIMFQKAWFDVINRLAISEEQSTLPGQDATKSNFSKANVIQLVVPNALHNGKNSDA